jgi:hypothetical protein
MRSEFITVSPVGAGAVFVAGILFGNAISQHDLPCALFGVLSLMVARENAREGLDSGSYRRGWFMWRRVGPATDSGAGTNVVPFSGPVA